MVGRRSSLHHHIVWLGRVCPCWRGVALPLPLWSGRKGYEQLWCRYDNRSVLHTMSCLSCSLGYTLTGVYAHWEGMESPAGGLQESYHVLCRTKQDTSLFAFLNEKGQPGAYATVGGAAPLASCMR